MGGRKGGEGGREGERERESASVRACERDVAIETSGIRSL